MGEKEETAQLIRDLRGYLEFQSRMGGGRVMPVQTRAPEPSARPAEKKKEHSMGKPEKPAAIVMEGDLFGPGGAKDLPEIRDEIGDCTRCKLHSTRKNIVFGEGNPSADIVFVGEGPGRDEDEQGRPFVGKAGKLLDKIIEAMKMTREDVYICNVVKCRPPENRNPEADEVAECEPFLIKQINTINPRVVVCLGLVAAKALLKIEGNRSLGSLRGVFHSYGKSKLMVTYHPAALLRNPAFKRPLWEDMQTVMAEISRP